MTNYESADAILKRTAKAVKKTGSFTDAKNLKLGVDLGTASIVLVVLDSGNNPVACEFEYSQVVRDGLVVDYFGAMSIVKKLKERLEQRIGAELFGAAIAVPPGTNRADAGTHRHVVEGCGLDVTEIIDEPTAANEVLRVTNGAVVDIGGGTTGLTVFQDGKAVYTADEATGGTHVSLVLMRNFGLSFEQAEDFKREPSHSKEVMAVAKPVFEKMASIAKSHIRDYPVDNICLVGGTCCLEGVEDVFRNELGVSVYKPANPHLVTPLGIAMSCALC